MILSKEAKGRRALSREASQDTGGSRIERTQKVPPLVVSQDSGVDDRDKAEDREKPNDSEEKGDQSRRVSQEPSPNIDRSDIRSRPKDKLKDSHPSSGSKEVLKNKSETRSSGSKKESSNSSRKSISKKEKEKESDTKAPK
jgi:hypothetical protein